MWLASSEFNRARMIEALADLILSKGGKVKFTGEGVEIKTRGYNKEIDDLEKCIERYEKRGIDTTKVKEKLKNVKETKAKAPIIQSRFMTKFGFSALSISFVIDDVYYHFEDDDNPFFNALLTKVKINDGKYYGEYYSGLITVEEKSYLYDDMWKGSASDEVILAAARELLTILDKAPFNERVVEKKRIRVPNTYNDGWHWETKTTTNNIEHEVNF